MSAVPFAVVVWVLLGWMVVVGEGHHRHMSFVVGLAVMMSLIEAVLVASWWADFIRQHMLRALRMDQKAVYLLALVLVFVGLVYFAL